MAADMAQGASRLNTDGVDNDRDVLVDELTSRDGRTKGTVKGAEKLDTLESGFRQKALRVVDRVTDEGYDVRVVWGRRSQEENQVLVEKGLASPTSKHLTGSAVDLINRANPYPNDPLTPYYLDLRR